MDGKQIKRLESKDIDELKRVKAENQKIKEDIKKIYIAIDAYKRELARKDEIIKEKTTREQFVEKYDYYDKSILEIKNNLEEIEKFKNEFSIFKSKIEELEVENKVKEKVEEIKENLDAAKKEIEIYKEKLVECRQKVADLNIDLTNEKSKNETLILELEKKENDFEAQNREDKEVIENQEKELERKSLELESIVAKKESEFDLAMSEKNTMIELKNNELEKVSQFLKWDNLYKKFLNLSDDIKQSLKGIFKGNDSMTFLYCGVKEENIDNFWEFIKNKSLINPENSEVSVLEEIFFEFFNAYNSTFDRPIFEKQNIEIGQEFDDFECVRTTNSEPSGKIKKIIFSGYLRTSDKKVMKKTIVVV